MPEDIDYKSLLDDMREKNLVLEQQVRVWESQWKGYAAHREAHWTVDIPKPKLTMGNSWSNVIGKLMSQDAEKLYRIYIIVCMVCVIVAALTDIYKTWSSRA